jgi:Flp pilus assembly protein TadG
VSPGRTRRRNERGAALVELAVALPLLAVILVGTIDFGRAFRTAMIVTNAARAGALYGSHSVPNAGDTAGMQAAATAVLTSNGLTAGTAPSAVRTCYCANTAGTFGSAVACNTTCASGQHIVATVTVTATRTFSMSAPFPGLPATVTITRGATARVQ